MKDHNFLCISLAMTCLFVSSCASRSYPATYAPDAMLIDADKPSVAHLYDAYGRYMSSGQFIDSCSDKSILSQADEELRKCRFKTKFSIYPSGLSAIQSKVTKARGGVGVTGSMAGQSTTEPLGSLAMNPSSASASVSQTTYAATQTKTPSPTLATGTARRIALVIGNSRYRNIPELDNPRNDAELIATTLTKLGFDLVKRKALLDLDRSSLEEAVKAFSEELHQGNIQSLTATAARPIPAQGPTNGVVALFYYAGHGVQERGENYLVPVDANPTKKADFDFQMVNVNVVLRQMESATTTLNMVVLDACRNSPFGGRGLRGSSSGLAEMQAPEGTLIAFATQSGNVAQDGPPGGNSPFAQAFAQGIQQSGLDQFGAFNAVAVQVKKMTGGAQQPWMSNSPIEGQFFFVPP